MSEPITVAQLAAWLLALDNQTLCVAVLDRYGDWRLLRSEDVLLAEYWDETTRRIAVALGKSVLLPGHRYAIIHVEPAEENET